MSKIEKIRQAVADYMRSEGCSCCRNIEAHKEHEATLAKLLGVAAYADGSGFEFEIFRTGAAVTQPTQRRK